MEVPQLRQAARLIAGLVWVALAGCDDCGGDPERIGFSMTLDRASYRLGDPIAMTVRNESTHPYTTDVHPELCGARLQVLRGNAWNDIPSGACTRQALPLGPGAVLTAITSYPEGLARGRYRYVARQPFRGGSCDTISCHAPEVSVEFDLTP